MTKGMVPFELPSGNNGGLFRSGAQGDGIDVTVAWRKEPSAQDEAELTDLIRSLIVGALLPGTKVRDIPTEESDAS